jgi:phytoene dehydrogenase-like protein
MSSDLDAAVVGSGPNGLAAAIVLARAGRRVRVYEARDTIGGGVRSAELTLPGFTHDVCSAIHAFAGASPFFRSVPLREHGVEWIEPPSAVAHPLDDGTAAILERSVEATARRLGPDAPIYRSVIGATVAAWPRLEDAVLAPLGVPRYPLTLARFGWRALQPASSIARLFATPHARALFAGIAAHGMLPLDRRPSAAFGLVLAALGHTHGWVLPKGGAQRLADALASYLRSLGGELTVGAEVASIDDVPARVRLCDLSPRPFLRVAGRRLPPAYRRLLERYRYGMGVFKMDWALDGPIPWRAAECAGAGTVHLGGTFEEIARAEDQVWRGAIPDRPFVLLVQPSLFDPTRAPAGQHTAWAYCHVPSASTVDMRERIEAQIERFAPGFRDRVLARAVLTPADLERQNPNLVGGDIAAGVSTLTQLFLRPTWRMYSTPVEGLYLCSASTPPGVGVHGMCGYHAARRALRDDKRASSGGTSRRRPGGTGTRRPA